MVFDNEKWSLVLWWWVARGLSYVWVWKVLEENKILPNEIIWTSIWALLWACFSLWISSSDIFSIWNNIKIIKYLDLDLKWWFVKWNKVFWLLKTVFWEKTFKDTIIPLKIISVNLDTWKKVVFTSWKIIDAVMASISVPFIFSPYEIDWKFYVDWGLISNLSVENAEHKNILALSSFNQWNFSKLDMNVNRLKLAKKLSYRVFEITIRWNEKKLFDSLIQDWKNIKLYCFTSDDIALYQFNKIEQMFNQWYEWFKKVIDDL